jgi:Ulp1 family protease
MLHQVLSDIHNPTRPRILLGNEGRAPSYFDTQDLARLHSPSDMLNDACINGGAALLQDHFSSSPSNAASRCEDCAILSTHDLPRIRHNSDDTAIWRNMRRSHYWDKDVWILPIHRSDAIHWVLCVIMLSTREILLFDSFAEKAPWDGDVQVCTPL